MSAGKLTHCNMLAAYQAEGIGNGGSVEECVEDGKCSTFWTLVSSLQVWKKKFMVECLSQRNWHISLSFLRISVEFQVQFGLVILYMYCICKSAWCFSTYVILFRYYCGSARQFNVTLKKNTPPVQRPNQMMTCQWNKTWTPTPLLAVSE